MNIDIIHEKIRNMKLRVQYTVIEHYGAFAELHTTAYLLQTCVHHIEEMMDARTIPFVAFQDQMLIPLAPLLDEMEWYPALHDDANEKPNEAAIESQTEGNK